MSGVAHLVPSQVFCGWGREICRVLLDEWGGTVHYLLVDLSGCPMDIRRGAGRLWGYCDFLRGGNGVCPTSVPATSATAAALITTATSAFAPATFATTATSRNATTTDSTTPGFTTAAPRRPA